MDISLVNLVIAVAILAVTADFNLDVLNRRWMSLIKDWETSIYRVLSALDKAKKKDESHIDAIEELKTNLFNRQSKRVDIIRSDLRKYKIEMVCHIKLVLSILITIEVIHISLQYFNWAFYEGIIPGLNKIFLLSIILLVFLFFIYIALFTYFINRKSKIISKFIEINSNLTLGYEFGVSHP